MLSCVDYQVGYSFVDLNTITTPHQIKAAGEHELS